MDGAAKWWWWWGAQVFLLHRVTFWLQLFRSQSKSTQHTRPEYPDRRRHLQTQAKANNAQQPPRRPRPFPPPLRLSGQEARLTPWCARYSPPSHLNPLKGSSKPSPVQHNVRCPLPGRFLLSSHLADMHWLCRREQQTPQRCGAVRNPAPAVHVQPVADPASNENLAQRRPSPSSREAGSGRCAVGNQPPTPQTIGDLGTGPLIPSYDLHLPCTLCILCCCDAKCAVACCPSVSVRYLLSRHILSTDQPPSGAPALPRRHHAVVPGARFLVDGRSRMTATTNQGLTDPSLSYKMRISRQPLWTSRGPQPPPQR